MSSAAATPLDIESCDRLVQQEQQFEQAGIRAIYLRGPAWAKANASAAQLEQVKLLIQVEEAIQFRCLRTRPLPESSLLAMPVPPAAPTPVPKVKTKRAAAAPADPATAGAPADPAAAPPKPKPKPAPRPPQQAAPAAPQ